jgi:hypothetical protein
MNERSFIIIKNFYGRSREEEKELEIREWEEDVFQKFCDAQTTCG